MDLTAAGVILVDHDGAILLQHRDENAPIGPLKWGIPGGRVESGESPTTAAARELFEEAGLTVGHLKLFTHIVHDENTESYIYFAYTDASQKDIILGEGKAMAFIPASKVLELDLVHYSRPVLRAFIESPEYRHIIDTYQGNAA